MARSTFLLLAMCLFAAGASAVDLSDCAAGTASGNSSQIVGGWTVVGEDQLALLKNITDAVASTYAKLINSTATVVCPTTPYTNITGCSQVTAGINYVLWLNVTCPNINGSEVTVVLKADLYDSVNDDNDDDVEDLVPSDIDVEGVYVDGVYVGNDLEDLLGDDADDTLSDSLDDVEHDLDDAFDHTVSIVDDGVNDTDDDVLDNDKDSALDN